MSSGAKRTISSGRFRAVRLAASKGRVVNHRVRDRQSMSGGGMKSITACGAHFADDLTEWAAPTERVDCARCIRAAVGKVVVPDEIPEIP